MQINGEKQLDDFGLDTLLLVHLSLEPAHGSGQTLPEIVEQVRIQVSSDYAAHLAFEDKLHDAGYFDVHSDRYDDTGYFSRELNVFHVRDAFPRLTESHLPPGVGGVSYKLSVPACRPFEATQALVVALLNRGI